MTTFPTKKIRQAPKYSRINGLLVPSTWERKSFLAFPPPINSFYTAEVLVPLSCMNDCFPFNSPCMTLAPKPSFSKRALISNLYSPHSNSPDHLESFFAFKGRRLLFLNHFTATFSTLRHHRQRVTDGNQFIGFSSSSRIEGPFSPQVSLRCIWTQPA